MRVLLVEDEGRIAEDVTQALKAAGYVVDVTGDGEDAWFLGDTEEYDAVILDLGLPGLDGLSILKRWRGNHRRFPILILSARGSWSERVEGIDAGADEYLPKPYHMEELLARLRAIIRRSTGQANNLLQVNSLILDPKQMRVTRDGAPLNLSPQEYRLLSYLMHHAGRVVTQIELTEHLYAQDYERDSNAIEVLVGRVRKKIGPELIETRRGFGYVMSGAEFSGPA
ncbi:winged helix family two component transcriptional regulator [Dongia mobilis]|uniref:Winged helix family two component transcriptional regulator n=1 Tax=Dongia mobilis TaxID=578943 RepID=A0A4R6WTD7_9PROT|nr:response regulator transcription factor [Dongia mobilis]TDQ82354.1 winged helix family two component transcriptional regulator [Dongia mobilis]